MTLHPHPGLRFLSFAHGTFTPRPLLLLGRMFFKASEDRQVLTIVGISVGVGHHLMVIISVIIFHVYEKNK
jgi:hypothetical protein